jgi:sugar phosphate isomerase/epimerase
MPRPQLTICLDDLKLEIKEAMDRARTLGFCGVDIGAMAGSISPGELSATGRRHLLKHLSNLGMRLGSLRGPVGGAGYADPAGGEKRLEATMKIIELAGTLRVPVVSAALGPVSGLADPGQAGRLREALSILADIADRRRVTLAIETVGIGGAELNRLLADVDCPFLAACCDSGALLISGQDPHRVAGALPGRIGHVRARDAVAGTLDRPGHEVSLGEGRLEVPRFLAGLADAGFHGDIVMTRTTGDTAAEDLRRARLIFTESGA